MITGNKNDIIAYLMNEGIETTWDLSPHVEKKHRSLDSNNYFHKLCDLLRQKLGISMARCKNHLIADYGQIEYIDDAPMIYKTNAPEEYMMELETIHTKCIRVIEENGKNVYFYRVYRGSHTYNSIEMNKLIAGTVEECKAQDIETLTPIELARLNEEWERKHG